MAEKSLISLIYNKQISLESKSYHLNEQRLRGYMQSNIHGL